MGTYKHDGFGNQWQGEAPIVVVPGPPSLQALHQPCMERRLELTMSLQLRNQAGPKSHLKPLVIPGDSCVVPFFGSIL